MGRAERGRARLPWEASGDRQEVEHRKSQLGVRGKMNSLGGWSGIRTGTWSGAGISVPGCDQMDNTLSKKEACFYFTSYCFFGQSDQHSLICRKHKVWGGLVMPVLLGAALWFSTEFFCACSVGNGVQVI